MAIRMRLCGVSGLERAICDVVFSTKKHENNVEGKTKN